MRPLTALLRPRLRLLGAMMLVASLCSVAPACSSDASGVPVSLSLHASIEGRLLQLRGRATVPDGAWIIYGVYRPDAPARRATGYVRVSGGRFAAQVDVSDWPPGEIKVDANFQMLLPAREQPQAVIARYGPNGERMTGKDVVEGGGSFRAAVASTSVIKR